MHRNRLLSALAFGGATFFFCSFALAADPPAKKESPKKGEKAKTAEPAPDPTPAPSSQLASTTTTTSAEATPAPPPSTPPKDADKEREPKKDDDEDKSISVAGVFGTVGHGLGYGVGLRAGYTFPVHLYVGAYAAYHFGSEEVLGEKITYIYPGVETGYDIRLEPVTLRPFVGAGVIFANASGPVSGSGNTPALWPGLALVGDIPKSPVFFGLDARLLYLTKGSDTALAAQLAAGVKL